MTCDGTYWRFVTYDNNHGQFICIICDVFSEKGNRNVVEMNGVALKGVLFAR